MTTLNFLLSNGSQKTVEVKAGQTIMHAALENSIPGIIAECAGSMACATCHVFIDGAIADRLGQPIQTESEMLEFTAVTSEATSRLSCQVIIEGWMDGMSVRIPKTQV